MRFPFSPNRHPPLKLCYRQPSSLYRRGHLSFSVGSPPPTTYPGATRPLVTKGRNRTFDLRSGYGSSSNLCLCALGIGHLLLHRSSTELPLHIWGGEQVMSLHPCVPLKRYRQRSVLHQGHRMNVRKNFNSFGKQYSFYTTFENELKFSGRKTSTHFCGVPNRTEH